MACHEPRGARRVRRVTGRGLQWFWRDVSQALDPDLASRRALDAGLVVHRADPLNAETPLRALGRTLTPNAQFYVRNHFQVPELDPTTWRLEVFGLVERPLSLSLSELQEMASETLAVTLECAGNGRSGFEPPIPGEQWNLGAVSTAEWSGVPLAELLRRVGPTAGARDLVFRGADTGIEPGHTEPIRYERGLSLDDARESETLLAYTMNGEPLPVEHGFPLRVVVPGWYGMASVKWLTEIELVAETFAGHFHSAAYFYDWGTAREPLTVQNVRSLITEPEDESEVAAGELLIRGVAWSGAALIERVEVSIDDGEWQQARLLGERSPHCWRQWELTATVEPGTSAIRARATDLAGRTQPGESRWNRLGYGNNAVQEVRIQIR